MDYSVRTLSPQESRVVLALAEQKRREVGRPEIIKLLGVSAKAADNVIESLRRKGWLERASWGKYLVIPPDEGPDALGENNLLALASRIADPYYIGYGSAATHYGLTTQHRHIIFVVTPVRVRQRQVGEGRVRVVNSKPGKFLGFGPVDVYGYKVMMSDREKTAIDCIDRPALVGGEEEAASILATRGPRTWMGPNPTSKVRGAIGYDKTWRLFVNVPSEELRESVGLGRRKALKKDGL